MKHIFESTAILIEYKIHPKTPSPVASEQIQLHWEHKNP